MAQWGGDWTRAARARWEDQVTAGAVVCHLCARPILPGDRWDIDHLVPLAAGGDMRDPANQRPAHRSCNRSRGAALGNRSSKRRGPSSGASAPAAQPLQSFAEWVAEWRNPGRDSG